MRRSDSCPNRSLPGQAASPSKLGFSIMELIIALSILSIIAGALLPSMRRQIQKSRDSARLSDIQTVALAIDEFYADHGRWPAANPNALAGNWDVSYDGDFISELRAGGYLQADVFDPLNDATYHYRYFVYSPGRFGCNGTGAFYVLGIRNFETDAFEAENPGFFACSDRDWGEEFAYVTGQGATP